MATKIFLTSGTTFTAPGDWPGTADKVELIGGGGAGAAGSPSTNAGAGGGGGAYAVILNLAISNGASYQIGQGGATVNANGTDTWIVTSGTALAKAGLGATTNSVGANGGAAASCIPSTGAFSGGKGGNSNTGGGLCGAGGGCAGGPNGTGGAGGAATTTATTAAGGGGGNGGGSAGNANTVSATGGDGGNNSGGTGHGTGGNAANGTAGTNGGGGGGGGTVGAGSAPNGGNGGAGTEFDASHGSGGGGGGSGHGSVESGTVVGNGGLYGAGGGGSSSSGTVFGTGANGIIVITYTPAAASVPLVGQTTPTGSGGGGGASGNLFFYRNSGFVAYASGTATAINMYVVAKGTAANLLLGLYDLNGNLLGGGSVAIANGLNTVALSNVPIVYGRKYYPVWQADASITPADDNPGGFFKLGLFANTFGGGLPSTIDLVSSGSVAGGVPSIYITGPAAPGASGTPLGGPARSQKHWR